MIRSVYACRAPDGGQDPGSVALASQAAAGCLRAAGCDPNDVDLVISAGVYRDQNVCEPAMGPLIQRRIGANVGFPPTRGTGTFSFDVMNGGCGFLNAVQIMDRLIRSGRVRRGVVVSSDVDPDARISRSYRFAPAAGALLMDQENEEGVFLGFRSRNVPCGVRPFEGVLLCEPRDPIAEGETVQHAIHIRETTDFLAACVDAAEAACRQLLESLNRTPADVDLVIASQFPEGFPGALAERIALASERVVEPPAEMGLVHTAAVPAALHAAVNTGRFAAAESLLLVSVAGGVSASAALYARSSATAPS